MEEKVIRMIIYYVLAVNDDNNKTIKACVEVIKLIIAMIKNEETKADKLIYSFPDTHPVYRIYNEIRDKDNLLELLEVAKKRFETTNLDNECLRTIEDDIEVENISKKL